MSVDPKRDPEILDETAPGGEDARTVRSNGWIGRNREALTDVRSLAAGAVMMAPLHFRIPLAAGCLAIDGALLAEEARTGSVPAREVGTRAVGLVLEGGALLAATRFAPGALSRNASQIVAVRRLIERLQGKKLAG